MRTLTTLLAAGLLAVPAFADHHEDADSGIDVAKLKADGYEPGFSDSDSIGDWTVPENPKNWTMKDGVLTGRGDRSHIFSPKTYRNVDYLAEVKINKGGNSGMYFRAKKEKGWPTGYEAQVNNSGSDPIRTGSVYKLANLTESKIPDDTWWVQRIRVMDDKVTVFINGKKVNEYTIDTDNMPKGPSGAPMPAEGHIAFQQHDPGSVVHYRNVMIKDLDEN